MPDAEILRRAAAIVDRDCESASRAGRALKRLMITLLTGMAETLEKRS